MRNFKRLLAAVILLLFFACNIGLSWLLYPYTYTRANFHVMIDIKEPPNNRLKMLVMLSNHSISIPQALNC